MNRSSKSAICSHSCTEPQIDKNVAKPTKGQREKHMPILLPVLIGIPVVLGGGWIIYTVFHH